MDLMMRTEETKKVEKEMVKRFCDRKASQLVRKSPEEIIYMWLDWQFARFKVTEDEDSIEVLDCERAEVVCAINKDTSFANMVANEVCDFLNNMDLEDDISEMPEFLKLLNDLNGESE